MNYTAAAIQFEPLFQRPDLNLPRLTALITEAAANGARLIVVPEMANAGYCFSSRTEAAPFMEEVPGPLTGQLELVAASLDCVLVFGMGEMDPQSRLFYNTAAVVGPLGYIGKYRKTHFFSSDAKWAVEGDTAPAVFDTPLGQIGVEICMDATYPETGRLLALQGADVVCFPTNWIGSATPDHRWLSQAFENGVYWVAANRWGQERGMQFTGGSCVVDPNGTIQSTLATGDGIVYGAVDTDCATTRRFAPTGEEHKLWDRQPSAYREMLQAPYSWNPTFFHSLYGAPGLPHARDFRVAVLQCSRSFEEFADLQAALPNPDSRPEFDILVVPALVTSSGAAGDRRTGESHDGLWMLQCLARMFSSFIAGTVAEHHNGSTFHTAVLVDEHGLVGQQRARHLTASEATWARPGDDPFVPIDCALGRIGLASGYDASFFETLRVLATGGADLVCVPANLAWETQRQFPNSERTWSFWRSKAWESCVALAFANYSSPHAGGGSGIWFPAVREDASTEEVASSLDEGMMVLSVDTHSRYIREKRGLGWRHVHLYTPLVVENGAEQ